MRRMQGTASDRIAAALLNLVYPARCPVCGGPTDGLRTSPICLSCFRGIGRYLEPACSVCFEPLASGHATTCGACLSKAPPFSRLVSYGLHEGALKQAVNLLKFRSARGIARELGALVATMEMPRADFMVPVPLSLRGLRDRGFNQTLLIARAVSRKTGVPVRTGLLVKTKDTPPQVGLPAKARLRNVRGAFGAKARLSGQRVLLIDDVVTTTATARECARALLKAGAGEVAVVSVSRARGR